MGTLPIEAAMGTSTASSRRSDLQDHCQLHGLADALRVLLVGEQTFARYRVNGRLDSLADLGVNANPTARCRLCGAS